MAQNQFGNFGPGGLPGIQTPKPYTPGQQSTPGLQGPQGIGPQGGYQPPGGVPHSAMGQDRASQGIQEQFADWVMPAVGQQSGREQYANQVAGRFNAPRNFTPGGGGLTNNAQEAYDQYKAANLQAGLDPYYDRARQRTAKDIDNSFAARGMHGSSAALQQQADASSSLNAQQANREADFRKEALGLGGQLGRSADISAEAMGQHDLSRSLAGESNQLNWLNAGANIAGAGDQGMLERMGMGNNIANAAQGNREARLQQAFQNPLMMAQLQSSIANDWYKTILGNDQAGFNATQAAALGYPQQVQANNQRAQDQQSQGLGGLVTGILGAIGL